MNADFHRVFDGGDIPSLVIEQLQGGIQRDCLATTRRARRQHHSVGLFYRFMKDILLDIIESQFLDAHLGGSGIQDTQNDFLAEQRRAGTDSEIDALVPGEIELDASILGNTLFRDVQPGHDFEPGRKPPRHLNRWACDVFEYAIQTVANSITCFIRFEMYIRGGLSDGIQQHFVDETHNRGFVDGWIAAGFLRALRVNIETDIIQAFLIVKFIEGRTGCLHRPFNGGLDLVCGHQYGFDMEPRTERNFIDQILIRGILHSDEELVATQMERQGLVFFNQRLADQADRRQVQIESCDVDQWDAVFFGGSEGERGRVCRLILDQPAEKRLVSFVGLSTGVFGSSLVQNVLDHQAAGKTIQIAGDLQLSVQ